MRALGLYVHIPFCLRKCAYCSFVSYPGMEDLFDRYIKAVHAEAGICRALLEKRTVDTVFFGGGTPSLLHTQQIKTLVDGLKNACDWQPREFTIEANPETLSTHTLKAYAELGVSRISIGLQTHDDAILARIGRGHTWRVFENAYLSAAQYFSNISVDIIFGLPGQSVESHLETVRRVIALAPKHVSAYALKTEPGTPLAQSFQGADEDADRAMYHGTAELLEAAGYVHYETSNFANPGFECIHNKKYWTGEDYLGLGVAAHSYIHDKETVRFGNDEDLDAYMSAVEAGRRPVISETKLDARERLIEYIMLRFRLAGGISFEDYSKRFGGDFLSRFGEAIDTAAKAGLIVMDEGAVRPTKKGFDLQNTLILQFIKKL